MLMVENKINYHCNTSCKITALQISLSTIKFSEKGKNCTCWVADYISQGAEDCLSRWSRHLGDQKQVQGRSASCKQLAAQTPNKDSNLSKVVWPPLRAYICIFAGMRQPYFIFMVLKVTNKIQVGIKNKPLGSKQRLSALSSKTSLLPAT
jgi:hypothetical protein